MHPTIRQRLQYRFDAAMARGTPALIGLLALCSLAIVVVASLIVVLVGIAKGGDPDPLDLGEALWLSLMHALDPGNLGNATGAGFRAVMLVVTLGGIFVFSALIGVLSTGLQTRMERLRKGRSMVLESGHVVILGWSTQIFNVMNELMVANENQQNACVVVLADKDKVEMEDALRERVRSRGRTRIVCRRGSPIDPNDLAIVRPQTARTIVVLPPDGDDPDTDVIKTVLAITNSPGRRPEPYHVVTQIRDPNDLIALKMIGAADRVQAILTSDLIARIVAQTSRQSGLSVVYTELLDFAGDEIYLAREPGLIGKTYGEALLAYEDSCVMGLRRADGTAELNPPMDARIGSDDGLFVLTADDDTARLSGLATVPVDEAAIHVNGRTGQERPERALVLNWNGTGATIVRELDRYVAADSQVTAVVRNDPGLAIQVGALQNQTLTVKVGDPTDRDQLDALGIAEYDHVIVLAQDALDPHQSDARTLVTLLHLRDMAEKDETPFSIVSEMLDLRNRELAAATKVDDFIVSEHLVSLMMAQLAENPTLHEVFIDLFDSDGSEIYLKPVEDYVATGVPVTFYTVVEAARRRGETALGYRLVAEAASADKAYGVHTNPRKSRPVVFAPGDKVIVVAES